MAAKQGTSPKLKHAHTTPTANPKAGPRSGGGKHAAAKSVGAELRAGQPDVGVAKAARKRVWDRQQHQIEAGKSRASKMHEAADRLMVSSSPTAQKQLQTIADTYIGLFTTTERRDGWPEHHRAAAQLALGHSGGRLRVYAADKLLLVFRASAPTR